ncbi:hypothetical protein Y88_1872 [Novosphingobium nitrogenifigens DSM 19370]|uniref:Right handed beta helix domain-containing protein n=1 Tax=Novosphingobium nitrogenifigens DSM 19370 TaxID=983920 RepID=F1Z533_9SPHN|nr:right-handed parallel beta-helix repeat-containing protein [Novosphingobium nitrogenifigens]EGD59998.1 hypothetical protein Y88_1872 [Novosphingobium nitrogenifigens DSM 19370]
MILALLASAASLAATPATIASVIASAPPGASIRLAPGDYGVVTIDNRNWARPIDLNADGAKLTLNVVRSGGVAVHGGTYVADTTRPNNGYAIMVRWSHGVTVDGATVTSARAGIYVDRSTDVKVLRTQIVRVLVDGIDIASSQRVLVKDSSCSDFQTEGQQQHPDCVQMWSNPKFGITQDVTIEHNRSHGPMQGFSGFNHVTNGVDDGGFDRIVIRDNHAASTYSHGVAINACRDCEITGNTAETLPGARWRTWVHVVDCTRCRVERNHDGADPR